MAACSGELDWSTKGSRRSGLFGTSPEHWRPRHGSRQCCLISVLAELGHHRLSRKHWGRQHEAKWNSTGSASCLQSRPTPPIGATWSAFDPTRVELTPNVGATSGDGSGDCNLLDCQPGVLRPTKTPNLDTPLSEHRSASPNPNQTTRAPRMAWPRRGRPDNPNQRRAS